MTGWPWPQSDVDFLVRRAESAFAEDRCAGMVQHFLVSLAVPDDDSPPIRNLRAWANRQPLWSLRSQIEAAEIHRLARQETARTGRRGDLIQIRMPVRWPVRNN